MGRILQQMRQGHAQNFGEEQVVGFGSDLVSGRLAMHPGQTPVGVSAVPTAQTGHIFQPRQQATEGSQAVKHKIVKR